MDWLDPYEIRARIIPTAIVFSPVIILVIFTLPDLMNELNMFFGETIFAILLFYALSFGVRHYGKKIESQLWITWDGQPSTRFMRWQDPIFPSSAKERIRDKIKNKFEISLLSEEEAKLNPLEQDKQISSAFLSVKAFLYRNDPDGLWKKHNMEYGFNRNLLGSRGIWLFFSILATIIFVVLWHETGEKIQLVGIVLNSIEVICSILIGWHYSPVFTREAADRYAESAWSAFSVVP